MNIVVNTQSAYRISPTGSILRVGNDAAKTFAVRSHLSIRLSAQAARELRDQAHGRLGRLLGRVAIES